MKSSAERLFLIAVLGCAVPALAQVDAGGPPPSAGLQGSSQQTPGQERYDAVGYAEALPEGGIAAAHGVLPVGSFAEVTSLADGKNILVPIVQTRVMEGGGIIALSPDALRRLAGGEQQSLAVRVRRVAPSPQDQSALRRREAASARLEVPGSLLVALRKKLPPPHRASASTNAQTRPPALVAVPPSNVVQPEPQGTNALPAAVQPKPIARTSGYFVQVAALSNASRARQLAQELGGFVASAGALHRVQIGPFPDQASAGRTRSSVAGRGYPDARIFHQ